MLLLTFKQMFIFQINLTGMKRVNVMKFCGYGAAATSMNTIPDSTGVVMLKCEGWSLVVCNFNSLWKKW